VIKTFMYYSSIYSPGTPAGKTTTKRKSVGTSGTDSSYGMRGVNGTTTHSLQWTGNARVETV
jgi:hypothetical protein